MDEKKHSDTTKLSKTVSVRSFFMKSLVSGILSASTWLTSCIYGILPCGSSRG